MTSSKISRAPEASHACPAEATEEPRRRHHQSHVLSRSHRLDDHAGHRVVEGRDPVVRGDDGLGHRAGGHAGRVGQAQGGLTAAPTGEQARRSARSNRN